MSCLRSFYKEHSNKKYICVFLKKLLIFQGIVYYYCYKLAPLPQELGVLNSCQSRGFLSFTSFQIPDHGKFWVIWRSRFDPWVGNILWRRDWQPTSVFLPGELHGQRSLESYSPWDREESDTTERLTHTYVHTCACTHTYAPTVFKTVHKMGCRAVLPLTNSVMMFAWYLWPQGCM